MIKTVTFPGWFRFDAITVYPHIYVRVGKENNAALIAHEQAHLADQRSWFVVFWWVMYLLSPRFRFTAEVIGHAAEVRAGGCSVPWAAAHITNRYWTFCTFAQAEAAIAERLRDLGDAKP